jgi:hypothetical protein
MTTRPTKEAEHDAHETGCMSQPRGREKEQQRKTWQFGFEQGFKDQSGTLQQGSCSLCPMAE